MFTGLITDLGKILTIEKNASSGATMKIKTGYDTSDLLLGESIAVDGACLTVTRIGDEDFDVDASLETLDRTTIGGRRPGDSVHMERAIAVGDRMGGHYVLGHVDGVGVLRSRRKSGNAWLLEITAPPEVAMYLIDKGSIAVNGVSLTVNWFKEDRFGLAIIPFTTGETNLLDYIVGREVNLEADVLGKYVRRFLTGKHTQRPSGGISMDALRKAGFE